MQNISIGPHAISYFKLIYTQFGSQVGIVVEGSGQETGKPWVQAKKIRKSGGGKEDHLENMWH